MQERGLLIIAGDRLMFWCPGCESGHQVAVPSWDFDGNYDAPTFSPSVLVYSHKKFINDDLEWDALFDPSNIIETPRCHSFVRSGHIEFLSDCTHVLAGQTVPMEPWLDKAF